ncbi:MAG: ATP-binding protein [Clostridiales bacterium]|jgi:predicted AAA+ superfamily ATPase|nr:ATP-binding protein [Clostridiales bacterium]
MYLADEAALQFSSLSVYKGILNRAVPGAFYRLLCAYESHPLEFTRAWGEFFALLCDRGYSENLAGCISETVLFDENAFSKAAAAGEENLLPATVRWAVQRDMKILREVAQITPEQMLEAYRRREELGDMADSLPRWKTGQPIEGMRGSIAQCLDWMADYYRRHGCGIYARYRAFVWREGDIAPVAYPDSIRLTSLKGYEIPRGLVHDNTVSFLEGLSCNNCLLYGDRGTGKSSTVKALLNEYCDKGLRMVEMPKESLCDFPKLVERIAQVPLRFIVFIDDLSFSKQDDSFAALKAVLEGGLAACPENALIYATSNRRHLLRERFSDREGDEVHRRDTIQESLSLADRFGLSVSFSVPGKAEYLDIVRALAKERRLNVESEALELGAERWALERGGRSPRCAKQYISMVESRIKRGLL